MYGYEWTEEYGIFRLTIDAKLQKEIRPVFHEELDFFGMDAFWDYPKDTDKPLLWAEGVRRYVMNGVCVAEARGGGFYTRPTIERLTEDRLQLHPVDTERLYEVNRSLMISIEQKAIHFIQEQYETYSIKGYSFVCAFSGGKDSLVLLDLCAKSLAPSTFYTVFNNTGMELSDTLEAVEKAKHQWPETQFKEAKCHMTPAETWEKFGPPASHIRWCCSVHKSVPTVLLLKELITNNSRVVVFDGVRAEESARRAKYSEVGEGVKNISQVNCHAILKWSSPEVFIYLLKNHILLNNAYRRGLYRVGCKVCPMSAKWQDTLISFGYSDEITNGLSILEKMTIFAKGKLDKKYIENGGWQARTGGKILPQGENRVTEVIENNSITFKIDNATQNWREVSPIFGHTVEESGQKLLLHTKHGVFVAHYMHENKTQTISISPFDKMDRFDLSVLRAIANKTAYCVGCKACMPQCPTDAFQIIDGKIEIRESACVHCYNCCSSFDKGCMVAKSLFVRSENMKNPDRYRNFGFRQAFYSHFLDCGIDCFDMNILGKDQYKSLKYWLADADVLRKKDINGKEQIVLEITELGEKLIRFGPYNPFAWAIMWANLSYDSIVARSFCLGVGVGEYFTKDDVIRCLDRDVSEKSKAQATNSLLSTFRDSPIGAVIKQGIPIDKTYLRAGWDYPDAVALLYTLYLYAERTGQRSFTFTQLVNAHNQPDAPGMSPSDIYGIDVLAFREAVQGLAVSFPGYIRASFVGNLDNIVLEDYTSLDILDLAKE